MHRRNSSSTSVVDFWSPAFQAVTTTGVEAKGIARFEFLEGTDASHIRHIALVELRKVKGRSR